MQCIIKSRYASFHKLITKLKLVCADAQAGLLLCCSQNPDDMFS